VLAILAMLALKAALRVAPGGSAPLFPSAPHHGRVHGQAGTGKQAHQPNKKARFYGAPKRGHSNFAQTGDILTLR
jgi:hypothetical protein